MNINFINSLSEGGRSLIIFFILSNQFLQIQIFDISDRRVRIKALVPVLARMRALQEYFFGLQSPSLDLDQAFSSSVSQSMPHNRADSTSSEIINNVRS